MSEIDRIVQALILVQEERDQLLVDAEIYGSNPKKERKLRKIMDILRTMIPAKPGATNDPK